jgi:hypothetical protein
MEQTSDDGRGWVEREIERQLKQIRDAPFEDPARTFSDAEFSAAVAELMKFAKERAEFVVTEVDRLREEDAYWAVP